jgi:predicted nuclease of predicted toxin-antitoxin system
MKFIIDEDLSPRVARHLCQEFCFDAIAVRDRGLLGATDPEVLKYAFKEDRILVTADLSAFFAEILYLIRLKFRNSLSFNTKPISWMPFEKK